MKDKIRAIEQLRRLVDIFFVVFFCLLLVWGAVSYYYKEPLEKSSCELCFELNPEIISCKNYTPININNLSLVYNE